MKHRSILAIDPSVTAFGWAWWSSSEDPRISYGTIHTEPLRKDPAYGPKEQKFSPVLQEEKTARLIFLRGAYHALFERTWPELVLLEDYAYQGQGNAAILLGELGGMLRVDLETRGIPVVFVAPNRRAQWATGKGNAGKAEVLTAAVRALGYIGHSHDEADALWMLHMALYHYRIKAVPVDVKQRRAIEKLHWPELR
jgi:Holliday junction resolvasome RuvABC endonuclease subunit